MSSYEKGNVIKRLRERKRWNRVKMVIEYEKHFEGGLAKKTLQRVEALTQDITPDTFSKTMTILDLPVDSFFCPYLIDIPMEVFELRDHLLYFLEWVPEHPQILEMARKILARIAFLGDYKEGINRQFILSCEIRLHLAEGKPPTDLLPRIRDAIRITYPKYTPKTFEGDILLFEEPTLIHCEALALARSGDSKAAIFLLERVWEGLDKLSQDDKVKERHLPPVLLDLARLLIAGGDYGRAVEVCDIGNDISLKRAKGRYTPDFVYNKALALAEQGKEYRDLLKPVYFGYIALRKRKSAAEVMEFAKKAGVIIETYGVEALPDHIPEATFSYGSRVGAKSIGDLIHALRKEAEISQEDLCRGVCNHGNLSRIELDEIHTNMYYLEVFFQRFGRDIDKYFDTFLSARDFEEKQMRDEVRALEVNQKHTEAQALLDRLKERDNYKRGVNLQFVLMEEASIYVKQNKTDRTHMSKLKEAWRVTKDDFDSFDEYTIASTRLTNYEIVILNQIAINLCENGELPRGTRILWDTLISMERFYVDESERVRLYPMILYNYSKFVRLAGHTQESLDAAIKGEELCLKYRQLKFVPAYMTNRATALRELKENEKSASYLAIAYYTSVLLGRTVNQDAIKRYAGEKLNLNFE